MKQKLSVAVVTTLFAALSTTYASTAPAGDVKIGVVDMQLAIQTVAEGKKARADLESAFNKKKTELQKEEASIKKMHEELQKQSMVMSEKALSQKQSEIQKRIVEFQQKTAKSQMELQQKEQELTKPIVDRLREVITGIAKQKGYTVILEKGQNSVLFSLDQDDLTQEIIQKYNSKS